MSTLKPVIDKTGRVLQIEINYSGQSLLRTPELNKGTAFTQCERQQFHLHGSLPCAIETLDQQMLRVYQQFSKYDNDVQKYIYLRGLYDTNETLFYKLVSHHLKEMLPIVYTPTIGKAAEQFSDDFHEARGLYVTYPECEYSDQIISRCVGTETDIIVISDGEGVLGIGDQGIGGMSICIAKLMVYVLCGGIHPRRILPLYIDVGTNNERLLNSPSYLGWRHTRLAGQDYDQVVTRIISAIQKHLPHAYIHWEDLGRENARRVLQRYRSELCTFNDDMQGTGVVTLAALLTAVTLTQTTLIQQRIVIFGAGTAGTGIADQLCASMMHYGLPQEQATSRIYLVDKQGLLTTHTPDLTEYQQPYAKSNMDAMDLAALVRAVKPTILIGCSSQAGAFTEPIIRAVSTGTDQPIILPLSNPTDKAEATPLSLLAWTNGRALIATGSPYNALEFNGQTFHIAQCNNALIYPGIGLGIIIAKATRLSDTMLWKAAEALSHYSLTMPNQRRALLPGFDDIHQISQRIALAVAEQARREGLSRVSAAMDFTQEIKNQFWLPQYYDYHYNPNL